MEKEKWINEVMNSLNGVKAEPGPYLYTRLMARIENERNEYVPSRTAWLIAASFLVLVVLNAGVIAGRMKNGKQSQELVQLAEGYNLVNNNTINYQP